MKAIVLTYDKQVGLAELVVKSYLRLWKDCPFQFMVPRNDDSSPHFDFLAAQKNVSIVRTVSSVRETMAALLDGVGDDEWIYWSIDDRYPVEIDQSEIKAVFDFIGSGAAEGLSGIKLIHWKETADAQYKDICIGDRRFRFQVPASTWGLWHHQFVRASVLKYVFLSAWPDDLANRPTALNKYLHSLPSISAFQSIVFPVERPIVLFGETLVQGLLLANACEALARYNCPVPDYRKDPRSVLFGVENSWAEVPVIKAEIFHSVKAEQRAKPQPSQERRAKNAFQLLRSWVQRQRQ